MKGDIIGVSSFGLCNSFSHVILKQNKKYKTNVYKKDEMFKDGLPRLILASGRTEQGVLKLIDQIKNSRMDEDFASLLQNVFYKSLNAHYFRSFYIAPDTSENPPEVSVSNKLIIVVWVAIIDHILQYLPAVVKRPIWFIFSGMGSQWNGMGKQLLSIPVFAESISKCEAILKPKGVDLINILTSDDPTLFDNILNSFVGIAAIQVYLKIIYLIKLNHCFYMSLLNR